ncbi:ABC transporter ATP-binding protein [Methyloterricola oryzae]|uniref:ABC transporter ATP-binding protein n=1 Tax=Methyloterricola oryzae TaxID=1495050 RepID=UPI0005EBD8DF|nr:ABC transporter ATP-binding protein [Methyloterricola oryzae]
MASVSFENVGKIYPNGHTAIRHFNLDIADGERMVFVGPSGCGKSTLLRLLAGLETMSEGRILIGGQDASRLSPQARNVAMVFQDYALYPNMTVRGNLEFPLRMRKLPAGEIRTRLERTAEMLALRDLLERLPRELSGGQRQRVAMGRALVREPAVFLLDEPLSNLDAKLRVQVRAEIGELQKRTGTTMVYVTHDQVEAMTLGERIAVLEGGRLMQAAAPEAIYEQPANPFVAGFMGSPPMNLFQALAKFDTAGRLLVDLWGHWVPARQPQATKETPIPESGQLTCGLRPEAFHVADDGWLQARALWADYLGHETLLYFRPEAAPAESAPLVARMAGQRLFAQGQAVRLKVDEAGIYAFAPQASLT